MLFKGLAEVKCCGSTHMTEDVVASVEQSRELVVRIGEVFEAILPQSHVLEAAERFVVALDPVRRRERHQEEDSANVRDEGADNQRIWGKIFG